MVSVLVKYSRLQAEPAQNHSGKNLYLTSWRNLHYHILKVLMTLKDTVADDSFTVKLLRGTGVEEVTEFSLKVLFYSNKGNPSAGFQLLCMNNLQRSQRR